MGRHEGYGGGNRITTLDKILAEYSKNPVDGQDLMQLDLTEEQRGILERWIFIDGLIRRHRPKLKMEDICLMVMRRYDISRRQFWIDFKNTDYLFGTAQSQSKAYARAVYIERLEQIASLAEAANDFKSAVKAMETAAKLRGLNEPDEKETDEPNKFMMVFLTGNNELGEGSVEVLDMEKLAQLHPDKYLKVMKAVDQPLLDEKGLEKMIDGND